MQVLLVFGLTVWLASPTAAVSLNDGTAQGQAGLEGPPITAQGQADLEEPPPTQYDLELARRGDQEPAARTMAGQLARTAIALLVVVGLIYLFAKLVLARMTGLRQVGAGRLKLLERLQLTPKQALFLVQVDGKEAFLIGATEKEVTLVSSIDLRGSPDATTEPGLAKGEHEGPRFADAMAKLKRLRDAHRGVAGREPTAQGEDIHEAP